MAAAGDEKLYLLVACALLLLAVGCQASPLQIGFYHDRCPQAEAVVKGVMMEAISQNPGNGAAMIRMLFHDCFVEDVVTPNDLDKQYYNNVLSHTVLFTSDAALLTSEETARMVLDNANIPGWWEDRFEKAMVKMAGIEVKTGDQGQIRKNCRAIN
ncbi:unnamed protein product [Triticum turgidum subsp. durum]|uniref:Plant heme peroxidase family profile domain-containing protein n=1 Tax=Triticum turgidum subsp. durum TaxID=4567 RepID=A0A9R1BIM8_TRITD|nr:unnamed protein product [Triticum turgidum subsp. durum]